MNKRSIAIAAAIVMMLSMAACSDKDGASSDTSGTSAPTGNVSQVETSGASVLSADIAMDTPVASAVLNGGTEDAALKVTFLDFIKEYKYRLAGYQITDDSAEPYASVLADEREYIVNYLINEKIMYKKFTELGLTISADEEAKIDSDTEAGIEQIKAQIKARIEQAELLPDEELAQKVEAEYTKLITDCGLTYDDIRNWQKSIVVQTKLTEHLNAEFVYDPTNTEQQVEALIESAKSSYEADHSSYNMDAMKSLWIPEGSRNIKHILLKFEDDVMTEISTLRSEGKTAEADALRDAKIAEMSDKISEVEGKVAAGEDFSELMDKYSDDGDTTISYLIVPGTAVYMDGFAETALSISEIGGTAVCVTDYGWHIIKYIEDAKVSDEDIKTYKDSLHAYMEEQYRSQNFGNAMKEWRTEYTIEIDRDLLLLGEETTEA